jgi:translation initiation factor 3 subunit M
LRHVTAEISIVAIQHFRPFMIDSMNKEYLNFLNKYLATFKGSEDDANAIGSTKEEAVAAIIEFVKSSNLFQVQICHI